MRAFIYCRVSTREQASRDHYSLDNQEQRCRDYSQMKKWQIIKLRKDVASGKNDERDGFQELLTCVQKREIDVVIVYRLDRLSRNVRDIYNFLDNIRESGVAFVSVTEGFDTTTAMGRAMLGVAAVFAQLTREMISENTKDGLLRRREAGHFVGDPTRIFGYDYAAEEGGLVVNEQEAAVLRQIFEWYTENKWGYDKIARLLNVQGVPSKTGVQWSQSVLKGMLSNPLVCGQMQIGETERVEGRHPGIISRAQFEMAAAVNDGRKKYPNRSQQSRYLLSGIARCGLCGSRLRGHIICKSTGSAAQKNQSADNDNRDTAQKPGISEGRDKASRRYYFYHHAKGCKRDEGGQVCKGLSKSVHILDQAVIEQIAALSGSAQVKQTIRREVEQRLGPSASAQTQERDKLLVALGEMEAKFSRWADRLDAGKIDEDQFEQQNQKLLTRKKQFQVRLAVVEAELSQAEHLEVAAEEVLQAVTDFPAVWEQLEHEERKELLRLLVEELKVFKTHAELKLLFLEPMQIQFSQRRAKAKTTPASKTVSTV